MSLDTRSLISRLSGNALRALEAAVGVCVARTHYEVDLEHWLVCMIQDTTCDVPRILRHFEIDADRLLADLNGELNSFKTGNSRRPELAHTIEVLVRDGWVQMSINFRQPRVRSGALVLAALAEPQLRRRLIDTHREIGAIQADALQKDFLTIVAGSAEDGPAESAPPAGAGRAAAGTASGRSKTPALDQYTIDLTGAARAGKVDPVLGRDPEIRQIIDVLMRRRQNNPILTGEAGVGKTAVVEGFALRIAADDVPEPLRGVSLRTLDLGLLQAGAGVKGEFENRLKNVIEEVQRSTTPIILFIDEAHTMIGAGGQEGGSDAANLLKPALARGQLRTIAATTWAEYKKYFEKDAALSRRFQPIKVEEPDVASAIEMMRGIVGMLEAHHRVRLLDGAVVDAVRLSSRYIPARQLPDKCVSVLDTACARVAIGLQAIPGQLEDLRRGRANLERERTILERESASGGDHAERLAAVASALEQNAAELGALEARWQSEKALVAEIHEIRAKLEAGGVDPELRSSYESRRAELARVQGERGLVWPEVDGQAVAEVIAAWTGIPIGKMLADEIKTVLALGERLAQRVIGQDHALEAIARRIRTSRAGLDNPARPVGVFLLAGPSGVGKTETALALADALYGGERNSVIINMSEYQEAHTVSSLKGSPPGYVGYGEGGVLTEAVRRRPYSVVLLDEVEKAHPDVMELFYQVFDKGLLEDAEGREIDFKNTVILLTTNVGSERIASLCADPDTRPEPEPLAEAIRPELLKQFPAAFLGRLVVIPYYTIAPEVMRSIAELQLGRIQARVRENHRAELVCADAVIDAVVARCNEAESGARAVDRILTHSLLPQISSQLLARMAAGQPFERIEVGLDAQGEFTFQLS